MNAQANTLPYPTQPTNTCTNSELANSTSTNPVLANTASTEPKLQNQSLQQPLLAKQIRKNNSRRSFYRHVKTSKNKKHQNFINQSKHKLHKTTQYC